MTPSGPPPGPFAGSAPGPADPAFAGTSILVGVCGGIAAYKVAHVVSALAQAGATVTVAMTEAAAHFVGPATFQALSGRPVLASPWNTIDAHDPQHVALARSLDAALVAPCTMNTLARLAHGFADDAVSLVLAAVDRARTPVLLAPSMNAAMLAQPATRRNLRRLVEDGYRVLEPDAGWQACRTEGRGRLPEPPALLEALAEAVRSRSA